MNAVEEKKREKKRGHSTLLSRGVTVNSLMVVNPNDKWTGVSYDVFLDPSGHQQIVLEPSGNRTTNVWDFENQNPLVRKPDGSRVTMAYNADYRRVRKDP